MLRRFGSSAATCTRSFATTRFVRAEVEEAVSRPQKRPVGGFRGGLFGFLLGFSLASGLASYHLLDEYKLASATLQASVEELQASTEKVSGHVKRIEGVEREVKLLNEKSATREEVSRARNEAKKLFDGIHIEFLDLRSHVWGIQQDIHRLSKRD